MAAAGAAEARHNGTLDWLRLLAAFGIVVFHTGAPGAAIGHAGLFFFLIVFVVLGMPAARRSGLGDFARGRARRLLAPFLVWSLIYGLLKLGDVVVAGHALREEFHPWMLLTGPALHLWFLPYVFVAALLLYPVDRAARSGPNWTLFGASTAICVASLWFQQDIRIPVPFLQWSYGLPAVTLGVAFVAVAGRADLQLALLLGLALTVGIADWRVAGPQLILAGCTVWLGARLALPDSRASRLAAALSMGIYLCHPLVLAILLRLSPLAPHRPGIALATCAGALAMALALEGGARILSRRRSRRSLQAQPGV